jgi:glycosyltransferase involved in cell wall biosynthesis
MARPVTRREGPRRLIHLGVPPRREALKAELGAGIPLGGAQIAESAVADALLKYRPLDEVCFVPTTAQPLGQLTELLSEYPDSADGSVIAPEDLARLPGQSLVFQNSPRLYEAAGLRGMFGRPNWPTVGLTHALSGADGALAALFGAMPSGLVAPFDRLVCTSAAGERAFTELQRQARASAGLARRPVPGPGPDGGPDPDGEDPGICTYVIPLGVDAEHFVPGDRRAARARLGIGERDIVFLYCGRFSIEYKMDPFPLLAAFAVAVADEPYASLIMAGDTSARGHVQIPAIAARLGIAHRVRISPDPSVTVKLQLYQAADVFISFSDNLQETFGLSIIEAMSCGLPVLASDWSGHRETVAHGETGFLVPTHWRAPDGYLSQVSAFTADPAVHLLFSGEVAVDLSAAVAAMRSLTADVGLRQELGRRGRDRVLRRYAWPAVMAAYRELFAALLDEAAAVGAPAWPTGAGYPPLSYDRRAAFGHFATVVGAMPHRVKQTFDGRVFAAAVSQVAPEAAEVLGLACPLGRAVASAGVLDCLAPVLGSRRAAVRAVQLLLKYGAIVAVP